MRRLPATALLLAPLLAACTRAPDQTDRLLVPAALREQHAAIADFMQARADAPLPECGLVHGKLISAASNDAGGIRVTLRNDVDSTSATTDGRGEFQLRAPAPGPTVLVVQNAGIDSITLPELQRFRGHVVTVEFNERDWDAAPLMIGRVYTRSGGCAGPPEN